MVKVFCDGEFWGETDVIHAARVVFFLQLVGHTASFVASQAA